MRRFCFRVMIVIAGFAGLGSAGCQYDFVADAAVNSLASFASNVVSEAIRSAND